MSVSRVEKVNGPRIDEILRDLRNGFSNCDHEHAIYDLLDLWSEKIGTVVELQPRAPHAVCFESRALLRLRGLSEPPVAILGEESKEMRQAVEKTVKRTASGRVIGILACVTESAFQYLRSTNSVPPGRCLVLSPGDLRFMFAEPRPLDQLRHLARNQIPYHRLIPFSISELAQGSMFVGRKDDLHRLVHENQDYALCGPGGIGKSSLLSQVKWTLRHMRDPRHARIVEVDLISCPADLNEAARTIAKAVYSSKFANELAVTDLDKFLKHTKASDARFDDGPIDLFIDETDTILALDSRTSAAGGNRYPLMRALKHAKHMQAIRITLSGRNGTRKLLDDPKNPFAVDAAPGQPRNHIKLIEVIPLSRPESEDLLLTPLEALGCLDEKRRRQCLRRLAECEGIPFRIQNVGLDVAEAAARQMT